MLWSGMVEKWDYYFCLTKFLGKEKTLFFIKVVEINEIKSLLFFMTAYFIWPRSIRSILQISLELFLGIRSFKYVLPYSIYSHHIQLIISLRKNSIQTIAM